MYWKLTCVMLTLFGASCSGPDLNQVHSAGFVNSTLPATSEIKLFAMDCGSITMPANLLDNTDSFEANELRTLPVPCYLIRHPQGDVMWDTGLPDAYHAQPVETPVYKMWVETKLEDQLNSIGVSPGEVDYLIVSHSHLDHAGNVDLFTNAQWVLHQGEINFVSSDFAKNLGVTPNILRKDVETRIISGDLDLFDDGVINLYHMPGHTGGHMVLLLNLPETGPVLFSGDLYHFPESRERGLIPDFNFDAENTRLSIQRFEGLADETGATVIIQHNPKDLGVLPKYPDFAR